MYILDLIDNIRESDLGLYDQIEIISALAVQSEYKLEGCSLELLKTQRENKSQSQDEQ